jgi:hypothetical protein
MIISSKCIAGVMQDRPNEKDGLAWVWNSGDSAGRSKGRKGKAKKYKNCLVNIGRKVYVFSHMTATG